ncbi:clasp N terminal-domain-containing protein, partial [Melampsora americana]
MPIKEEANQKIIITSPQQCHHQFDLLKSALSLDETEDTWLKIDASLQHFTAAIRGGACDFPDDFLRRWKESDIVRGIVSALSTERTRLSGTALDLIGSASRLGSHWDSAIPFYIPTIIKLLARASKIYVTRASIALNTLIRGTRSASFIPLLLDGLSDKSISVRIGCADGLLCCLGGSPERDRDQIELIKEPTVTREGLNKRLVDIESAIKIGGRDRDPKVRAIFKRIWVLYQKQWPTRASALSQPFTPTIKRYLGLNKPAGSSSVPPQDLQPSSPLLALSHRATITSAQRTKRLQTQLSLCDLRRQAITLLNPPIARSPPPLIKLSRSLGSTLNHRPVGSS